MFWVKGGATGFGRQNVPLRPNDNLSNNTMSYSCTVSVINLVNDFFLPRNENLNSETGKIFFSFVPL